MDRVSSTTIFTDQKEINMNTCEQKVGIFTLKKCENKAEHQCEECGKYICNDHFTEEGLCKSCYSLREDDNSLFLYDNWYWYMQRRRYHEQEEDMELMAYTDLISDEAGIMVDEFEQQEMDSDEFDESDVSFFDS